MDKILFIKKVKNILNEIMTSYPKSIEIERNKNELKIELTYPLGYEYRDFYKERCLDNTDEIKIDLDNIEIKLFQKHIVNLIKIKKFLKHKNNCV